MQDVDCLFLNENGLYVDDEVTKQASGDSWKGGVVAVKQVFVRV